MLHRSIADTAGMDQTRILRGPTIAEKRHRPQSLRKSCVVRRSGIERIAVGNNNNPKLPRYQKTVHIWQADHLDYAIASCQK